MDSPGASVRTGGVSVLELKAVLAERASALAKGARDPDHGATGWASGSERCGLRWCGDGSRVSQVTACLMRTQMRQRRCPGRYLNRELIEESLATPMG